MPLQVGQIGARCRVLRVVAELREFHGLLQDGLNADHNRRAQHEGRMPAAAGRPDHTHAAEPDVSCFPEHRRGQAPSTLSMPIAAEDPMTKPLPLPRRTARLRVRRLLALDEAHQAIDREA